MKKKQICLRYMKNVDMCNKLYIPECLLKKFGRDFYLEVYENEIVLVPINKEQKTKKSKN